MKRSSVNVLAGAAVLLSATAWPALTQEFQPFPSPKVTAEQWQSYLEVVRMNHEATAQIYKERHLIEFSSRATRTSYIFTTRDHPAHPAWITRQVIEIDGTVSVRQVGYFAGAEEPFARLFAEFQQRNEQLRENIERRNQ